MSFPGSPSSLVSLELGRRGGNWRQGERQYTAGCCVTKHTLIVFFRVNYFIFFSSGLHVKAYCH